MLDVWVWLSMVSTPAPKNMFNKDNDDLQWILGYLLCKPMCLVSGCWDSKLAGPKPRNIHIFLRESLNDWWIVRNPDWKPNVSVGWTIDFIQLVYQPTVALTTHWDWNKTNGLQQFTDPTHPNHCFQRSRTIKLAASSGSLQSPFHNCY